MDVQKVAQEYRLKQWAQIIAECRRSGKTAKSYCQENNINLKSYYYYQKRVRTSACNLLVSASEESQEIVPINVSHISSCIGTYDTTQTAIVLNINSIVIEIKNGAADSTIENTLKAIKNL